MQPERVKHPSKWEQTLLPNGIALFRATWILMLVIFIWMSSGCSAMKPQTAGEWTFHALNAIDTAQTISHGADPCYVESNGFTNGVLGDNPKPAETIAFMLAASAVHRFVSWEMQRNDVPGWVQRTWEVFTIAPKAHVVWQNHQNGIRPWGNNDGSKVGCNT